LNASGPLSNNGSCFFFLKTDIKVKFLKGQQSRVSGIPMDLLVGQSGNSLLDKSSHLFCPLFFFSNADILLLCWLELFGRDSVQ
jgi:hypothetical protein